MFLYENKVILKYIRDILISPPREIFPFIYVQFLHKMSFTDLWVYKSAACKKSIGPNVEYHIVYGTVKVE
jgi:hypothetical protein